MIVFISASGNVPLVMFCLKKRPRQRNLMIPILPNEIATRYGSTADVFAVDHCTTETGFIREEQFQQGIQKFAIVMQERYPEKQIILLADNIRSHRTLTTLQKWLLITTLLFKCLHRTQVIFCNHSMIFSFQPSKQL
jgi:hypothetical protein